MKLSSFGKKFTSQSGILSLMDDLGSALAQSQADNAPEMIMMGGGNPAHIPHFEQLIQQRIQQLAEDETQVRRLVGIYDPPQGELSFVSDIARLLKRELGWNIDARNIALTNGSQSSFFMLFNMLAGDFDDGSHRKIQLPLCPEYIGYADAGLTQNFFAAARPQLELLDGNLFKYRVDFEQLKLTDEIAALCLSRPTNPTGNVVTDAELEHLDALAQEHNIPLIIDSAYGTPFPNLIYTAAKPLWNENTIVCLSLSKLGLPAARTGIVVAHEEVIRAVSGINAILNLAPGSLGALLAEPMVKSGEIIALSNQMIKPYYQAKAQQAVAYFHKQLSGLPYRIHKPEGAMFLWLWFEDLPISSLELYERLKAKGVLVVSGHYFFPGMDDSWIHQQQCIRVTYSQDETKVRRGIEIIAEEVRQVYSAT